MKYFYVPIWRSFSSAATTHNDHLPEISLSGSQDTIRHVPSRRRRIFPCCWPKFRTSPAVAEYLPQLFARSGAFFSWHFVTRQPAVVTQQRMWMSSNTITTRGGQRLEVGITDFPCVPLLVREKYNVGSNFGHHPVLSHPPPLPQSTR